MCATPAPTPTAPEAHSLSRLQAERPAGDLWVFAYASLIWRPEFEAAQALPTRVHGWHRALKMWSRINRGTPARPGLVFALLSGGSCQGLALRVPEGAEDRVLAQLWAREMPTGVYRPRFLRCATAQGTVQALSFTLPRSSPHYTGVLSPAQYRAILADRVGGRYGHTLEYAQRTLESLRALGIEDRALARLLKAAD